MTKAQEKTLVEFEDGTREEMLAYSGSAALPTPHFEERLKVKYGEKYVWTTQGRDDAGLLVYRLKLKPAP